MVQVLRVDPYDPVTAYLVPYVSKRIYDMAKENSVFDVVSPERVVENLVAPLWHRSPTHMVLAFVNDKAQVVGHLAAAIFGEGQDLHVFVVQCKFDDNVGDARWQALSLLDDWGRKQGAKRMRMVTPGKNEKPWTKKYGFKVEGLWYGRDLGARGEAEES